jgi:predicted flavoprotein YhiN
VAWAAVSGQNANNSLNGTATSFTVTLPGNATIGNRVSLQVVAAGNGFTPTVGVTGLGATWAEDTFTRTRPLRAGLRQPTLATPRRNAGL